MTNPVYITAAILCSLVLASAADARDRSGQNRMLYGNSAEASGRGGTGLTGTTPDFFGYNPASVASLDRPSGSLQYGGTTDGDYNDPEAGFFLPSSYGVFGGSLRMLRYGGDEGLTEGYRIRAGAGKEITNALSLGAALDILYGGAKGTEAYTGAAFGARYRTGFEKEFGRGFGIFAPSFGICADAGLPFGSSPTYVNMNKASVGYSLGFYRSRMMTLSLYNELSLIRGYSAYPVTWGIESALYGDFLLRIGGSYPAAYGIGDLTCGAGYRLDCRYFTGTINYALVHRRGLDFVHYLGATASFGEADREPPVAIVTSSEQYISPNHDGIQDYALIRLDVTDRSRIKGWKLQILDPNGAVVREYKGPSRDMEADLSLRDFFERIISRRESAVVPDAVLWDGTDAKGGVVADSRYRYSFMIWDDHDNYSERKSGEIVVDNAQPDAELSHGELLFSPNGDGKKDEFAISQKFTSSPDDEWSAGFIDASGKTVRSYHWNGSNPITQIRWDGRDDGGANLPEGLYGYFVTSRDKAGNSVRKTVSEITLTRRVESANLYVQREYFSYLLDKTILFKPVVSSKNGMESWKITVETADGKPVKILSGTGAIPDKVEWNVADDVSLRIQDGIYHYYLSTAYRSGSEPDSFKKKIIVDSTPPKLSLDFTPSLFSPDGDGIGDILTIIPSGEDQTAIVDWSIDITYTGDKQRSVPFKRFTGKGTLPKEIKWDGTGDKNDMVESATDYYITITATDKAGNVAKSDRETIPVDVLVMVTESGLKIRISTIEFEFDSAIIGKKSFRILNRVAQILDKYSRYKVRIEGHTDDIGDDAYNLKLSEDRALAVRDYLVSKGLDAKRLSLIGRGETVPLVPNRDEEARRKNRRVEFILEK